MVANKIICIVGPTASGKSGLAMRVARKYDGEIICADSQTVRRGLDIGTAKPTEADRAEIPHHLLDVVEPYERFSVAEFQRLAEIAISDILSRGKVPIVVGGTGLYVDALAYGFKLRADADLVKRKELELKSVVELQDSIEEMGLTLPENKYNPRHLVRVIETKGEQSIKESLREGVSIIGLDPGKEALEDKIENRISEMIDVGFLDEVEEILEKYGEPPTSFDAIGYKIALANRISSGVYAIEKIIDEFRIGDRQYAKRQRAWFKRNRDITWFEQSDDAFLYIEKLLG